MRIVKHEPLSEHGSFKNVVNVRTARRRRRKAAQIHSDLQKIVFTLAFLLIGLVLWAAGTMPAGIGFLISLVSTCILGVLAGRMYEKFNK